MISENAPAATLVEIIPQPAADPGASTPQTVSLAPAEVTPSSTQLSKSDEVASGSTTTKPALAALVAPSSLSSAHPTLHPKGSSLAKSPGASPSPSMQRIGENAPLLSTGNRPRSLSNGYQAVPTAERKEPVAKRDAVPAKASIKSPGDDAEDMEESDAKDAKFFGLLFGAYVFVALGNRLFQKLETMPMYNYPMFLNLLSTVVYVPASFAYIIPMVRFGDAITPAQQAIPKHKFLVMGALDSISGAMQIFAVNYITSGSTIVLIQQSAIPISMMLSKMTLGATYSWVQYLGAFVVCVGIFIVLAPQFLGSGGAVADEDGATHNQTLWCCVMMLSCVPMVLSSVYKESALRGEDIDVVYLNGWIAVFQFLIGLPLLWPSALASNLPIDDLIPNLIDGFWCFLGVNHITEVTPGSMLKIDDCASAPLLVTLYLAFNLTYNVLIIMILKFGSANIMFMGSTALVPLTNALFACQWIPGHKPLELTDLMGLIVIMSGICTYRFVRRCPCEATGTDDEDDSDDDDDDDEGDLENSKNMHGPDKKHRRRQMTPRKEALYYGFNATTEVLQPLLETRVKMARQRRHALRAVKLPVRSSDTRSPYLSRLGIAPSPRIGASPRMSVSPGPPRRSPAMAPKGRFK